MKQWIDAGGAMLLAASVLGYTAATVPSRAAEAGSPAGPTDAGAQIAAHGKVLFISYGCGWCHEAGGRKQGRGPQLMDTKRDDEFIINRIVGGSPGRMPAFGNQLVDTDIRALIAYIRSLKPET
ncbi:MAG TPA: cytochrome c [Xanthobacteraceae bacterium]|nr:cytochrome c [Xanthobacteraceae bacterium]